MIQAESQARLWDYLGKMLEQSDGEISEELQAELQRLEATTEESLSGLLYLLRRARQDRDNYSAESDYFKAKAEKRKAQEEYLRTLMQRLMQAAGLASFKTTLGSASVVSPTGQKVIVEDVMKLPEDYRESELVWKARKAQIEVAVQAGHGAIPGTRVEPKLPYIQVRLS